MFYLKDLFHVLLGLHVEEPRMLVNYLFENKTFKPKNILNGKEKDLYKTSYELLEKRGVGFLYKRL